MDAAVGGTHNDLPSLSVFGLAGTETAPDLFPCVGATWPAPFHAPSTHHPETSKA